MVYGYFMSHSRKDYPLNLVNCLVEGKFRRDELAKLTSIGRQIRKMATWVGFERYVTHVSFNILLIIILQGTWDTEWQYV